MALAWLVLLTVAAAAPGLAMTIRTEEFTCPICGTAFKQDMVGSSTSLGRFLDGCPDGAGGWPWPLPVCPKCHFVLFRRRFSAKQLAALRAFVTSPEYAALVAQRHSEQYRAAVMQERLGASHADLATAYLAASWLAPRAGDHFKTYAAAALRHLDAQIAAKPRAVHAQLLRGELLRGLGRFDEAEAHFRALKPQKAFAAKAEIIAQELELIADRDREREKVGREPRADRKAHAMAAAAALPGWRAVTDRFDVVDSDIGRDDNPTFTLRARKPEPIAAAIVDMTSQPEFDWQHVLAALDDANRAARAAIWLREWLAAGANRSLQIALRDDGPPLTLARHQRVLDHVHGRDARLYEITLRAGRDRAATVLVMANGAALVVDATSRLATPRPGTHWLDAQTVSWAWPENPQDYLSVDADGRWARFTIPPDKP